MINYCIYSFLLNFTAENSSWLRKIAVDFDSILRPKSECYLVNLFWHLCPLILITKKIIKTLLWPKINIVIFLWQQFIIKYIIYDNKDVAHFPFPEYVNRLLGISPGPHFRAKRDLVLICKISFSYYELGVTQSLHGNVYKVVNYEG